MEETRSPQAHGAGAPVVDEYGGDSRPPVYWDPEVEKWVYRAYSLGNCTKALTAFRQGITPADHPDWLLRAFREGHENEPVILDKLYAEENGYPWRPAPGARQGLIEIPVGSGVIIRGHSDDVSYAEARPTVSGSPEGELRVVEVKAFAPSTYKTWRRDGFSAFPYYATQLSAYMHGWGLPALFVIGVKNEETRVVEKLEVYPVDTPPVPMAQIKLKVMQIERWAQEGGLPGCSFKQYPCQMFFLGDEDGCGGSTGRVGHDGKWLPKPTSKKRLEEINLEAQLKDSVDLERLNGPAEMIFEGTKLRNRGNQLVRDGEEELREWQDGYPKVAGEPGGVQKYQTSKWNVTVHPVGGVAVRPRRDPNE